MFKFRFKFRLNFRFKFRSDFRFKFRSNFRFKFRSKFRFNIFVCDVGYYGRSDGLPNPLL